jgi:pimeloyl-ACP methyl ester carboxylesterase
VTDAIEALRARAERHPTKPDVVYLHAAGGYRPTAGLLLLAEQYNVFAIELPGIGPDSPLPGLATLAEYAAHVEPIIEALDLDGFSLVATSFGGAVALWYATRGRGPRPARIALESPAALLAARPSAPATVPAGDGERPHAYRVSAASDQGELERRLPDLDLDVLVAFGTTDERFPVETGRRYAELLPRAFVTFVYGAGHGISQDRPEAFAELFADFLERGAAFVVAQPDDRAA